MVWAQPALKAVARPALVVLVVQVQVVQQVRQQRVGPRLALQQVVHRAQARVAPVVPAGPELAAQAVAHCAPVCLPALQRCST